VISLWCRFPLVSSLRCANPSILWSITIAHYSTRRRVTRRGLSLSHTIALDAASLARTHYSRSLALTRPLTSVSHATLSFHWTKTCFPPASPPTPFRVHQLPLSRWTTHTVLVSRSQLGGPENSSHGFAGCVAGRGCQFVAVCTRFCISLLYIYRNNFHF
jgi:hypothetical protein